MALVLAAGPGAAASHRSAAALLGFPGFARSGAPEVTAPRPRHQLRRVVVHRSRASLTEHVTAVAGIATTRVPRTLVDLAGALHPARVERAVDNCLAAGSVTLEELRAVTLQLTARGRRGIALMHAILEARGPGYVATESELEARFAALVRASGLPEPVRQLDVGDAHQRAGRVDFAYPAARLVVEIDSRRHHQQLLDREADRGRDHRLVAGGWRAVRITSDDLSSRPAYVTGLLRELVRPQTA
jgi:very-short-patch-repair endonuclease